ncbi:putative RDD family membrane protein YckC [Breoghania corrubedonensis]|uniref:Putative RDD family membrane protein YckC n=1 Tax=Breoghania corrubedonensis TaxID=665038 RepID=A0A2T5VC36_9HYPH|nr:RDD family protein [Breoghania corrubedonensis]PTW61312.1 putative RDD family membrane protein YckC [Breoghania corrubedonensis]
MSTIETNALYDRDPLEHMALFEGVRTKRIFAFMIDVIAIAILTFMAGIAVFFLGIFTLGLGWLAYAFLWQGVAILYSAFTLGGPFSATPGMRAFGIELRLVDGRRPTPLLAIAHVVLFWVSFTMITPLVLLVSLFSNKKRLLHDIIVDGVVVNSSALARTF